VSIIAFPADPELSCFVLSLKLLSPAISRPSYTLSAGSESMNASNTSFSFLPKEFSQLKNSHTCTTSSLFNVLVVLALHPSLLLLGHRHHPLLKLMIAPFCMLYRFSGINSLYLFVNIILVPVPTLLTHLLLDISLHPLLFHHSAHPQLPLAFATYLKLTCFTNSIFVLVVPLVPTRLPSRTFSRTVSFKLIICFFFDFLYFFCFCAVR